MGLYREFKQLNLASIDEEILNFWNENKIFDQSISSREGNDPFVFYEGPPSANGMPGIHHVMSRTIKDLFCRYKTLQGFQVNRKGGWDTHGLPVELQVEKKLGITKEDIGKKISIEDYNKECRSEVMKFKDAWDDLTMKMGYWVDLNNPYITFKNEYIETLWYLLKQFYEKDLLYEGYSIQPYSPAAGTGLSQHELNLPGCYRMVKDTTVVVQFKLTDKSKAKIENLVGEKLKTDIYFLAWTTTPWTLPANTALAVGEKIEYSIVRTFNGYSLKPIVIILASELVGKYFDNQYYVGNSTPSALEYISGWLNRGEMSPNSIFHIEQNKGTVESESFESILKKEKIPFKTINECKGKDLENLSYEQLLPYVKPTGGDAFKVVIGDFVSTDDGTGIVHISPTFGADDFRSAKKFGIGSILVKDENGKDVPIVDKRGRFVKEITDFAGEFVKEDYLSDEEKEIEREKQGAKKYLSVDIRIADKLKKENKAFKVEKYEHNYPHCWRTDKPVLYYPLDSWFIRSTAKKERMAELNKTINWKPESTGTGRFGNWLENLQDWNLSRSRFWGTPLPIWKTEDKKEEKCIGSIEELTKEFEKAKAAGFNSNTKLKTENGKLQVDLHRPYVDEIVLVSDSGKPMQRVEDLIDVWFDSGAMPYAQWHYPFENKNLVDEKKFFPADFIAEGVDQTRGWFFTLHAIAAMLFDSVAFKNVVSNGLVLDKKGNKMSKRIGNVVNPFEAITNHGADAVRWYLMSNSQPWDNLKFDMAGIEEVKRKFFGTLYNTYSFFALYANIDSFEKNETETISFEKLSELDRWIISKLQSLISEVTSAYENYEPTQAARAIESFVDEHLSNWYVRLSRRRFWKGEISDDKKAAYETLFECLVVIAQLMSPVAPFFSEWLYKNLTDPIRKKSKKINSAFQFDSVHLTFLTKSKNENTDKALEERMMLAQEITSLVFSLRKKVNIKVRQPLQKMLIPVLDNSFKEKVEQVKELILSEVNVKELEYVSDTEGVIKKRLKPDFKLLGARMGKKMKAVSEKVANLSQNEISDFEKTGLINFLIEGENLEIRLNEVEVFSEDIPGWQVANNGELTVALDITINNELLLEGNARELVNRIQRVRKDLGFEVTDHISIKLEENPEILSTVNKFKTYICGEILADTIVFEHISDGYIEVEVNEITVKMIVNKNFQ